MKIKLKIEGFLLLSLNMEDGEPQVFPSGFAVEAGLFPDGRFSPSTPAELFDEVGAAQMEGMLAIFPVQTVRGFIEIPDLFGLQGVFKEGILNRRIGGQVEKNNARGPVTFPLIVDLIEKPFQDDGKLQRIDGGSGQLCFHAAVSKLFFFRMGTIFRGDRA